MKMYDYSYDSPFISHVSQPWLEKSEKMTLLGWYRWFHFSYGRWHGGILLTRDYSVNIFRGLAIQGSLYRLPPRPKKYPKKRYRDYIRHDRGEFDGISCHGSGLCPVCREHSGYLPLHWMEFGHWWEAHFCREHSPEDLK